MKDKFKINSHQNTGILILLFVTMLWGGTFSLIKGALNDSSPMMFIVMRFLIASVLLLPLAIKYRVQFTKSAMWAGFILGIILFASFATQTTGLNFTSATKSGFITGTSVVIIPILQTIIEKRKPTIGALLGTMMVVVGIIFLSSPGNSFLAIFTELGANFNLGDFLTLLTAIFYAFYMVYLDVVSKKASYQVLFLMQIFVTALFSLISLFIFDATGIEEIKFEFSNRLIFALIYTSILATILTTGLQTKYQQRVTPTKAGIIFSFEPIFAAIIAFFLLSEKMNTFGFIGCVLIFSGLIVAEVLDKFLGKNNGR